MILQNFIIMKLQNWLIYQVAKTALFVVAFLGAVVALTEIIALITGRAIGLVLGDGFPVTFEKDVYAGYAFYDRILAVLPGLLIAFGLTWSCWQLGKMLQSIEKNKQFYEPNYKRVYHAGACIILVNLLLLVVAALNNNLVRAALNAPAAKKELLQDGSGFSLAWLAVGCMFMILAKVFQRGTELQKDHDLTF